MKVKEELVCVSDLVKGQGADEVISLLNYIATKTKCNIAVIGGFNTGKSTMLKVLAMATNDTVSLSETDIDSVLASDDNVIAIGEVASMENLRRLIAKVASKRIFYGAHYNSPVRMIGLQKEFLRIGNTLDQDIVEKLSTLSQVIISMGITTSGFRFIDSITQVMFIEGEGPAYRELAYYDVLRDKYVVNPEGIETFCKSGF